MPHSFSHLDDTGALTMVDVSAKKTTERRAVAEALVDLAPATMALLREKALPKGEALACARIAGIMAAKRAGELIPLCHPLTLSFADIRFFLTDATVRIEAETRATGPTGVEMEALVAAQTAALTVYDMCKAVQKDMEITDIRLLSKSGGKSGTFIREP